MPFSEGAAAAAEPCGWWPCLWTFWLALCDATLAIAWLWLEPAYLPRVLGSRQYLTLWPDSIRNPEYMYIYVYTHTHYVCKTQRGLQIVARRGARDRSQVPVLEGKELETMRRACKLGREAQGAARGRLPPKSTRLHSSKTAGSGHRCSLHAAWRHRGRDRPRGLPGPTAPRALRRFDPLEFGLGLAGVHRSQDLPQPIAPGTSFRDSRTVPCFLFCS